MSQHWAGSTTSYRLYCQSCDAQEVFREDDLEATDWRVTSLHFHEGECPACARTAHGTEPATRGQDMAQPAADGGRVTLDAFAGGEGGDRS